MDEWKNEIKFISKNKKGKQKAIELVNKAIEMDAEILKTEGLIGNLKDYLEDLYIRIFDEKREYHIDLGPKSGEGHDFTFSIKKKTNRIDLSSLCIGEVIQPDDYFFSSNYSFYFNQFKMVNYCVILYVKTRFQE